MAEPSAMSFASRVLQAIVRMVFGPGWLGRIGTVVIAAMVCCCVTAIFLSFANPLYSLLAMVAGLIVLALFLILAFGAVRASPELAGMDGAQILKWAMIQNAARDHRPPIQAIEASPIVQNPRVLGAQDSDDA